MIHNNFEVLPAIANTARHPDKTSNKYTEISTLTALTMLQDNGFYPVAANQTKCKNSADLPFAKHAIKFEHEQFNKLSPVLKPQLLLLNAHNGTSSFKLLTAYHVFLCSNGLVKYDGVTDAIRVLHLNFNENTFQAAIANFMQGIEPGLISVESWRNTKIEPEIATMYAQKALDIRWPNADDQLKPTAKQILTPRRYTEKPDNLWSAYQIAQENIIKGGLQYWSKTEIGKIRLARSRSVQAIDSNVSINQKLWQLTAETSSILQ